MAIIHFPTKKYNKTEERERYDYKDRIKSYRYARMTRAAVALVAIAIISAVLYVQWKNKIYVDCETISSAEMTAVSKGTLYIFDGKILSYGKDGASCVNTKGEAVWNITYEMQNPMIEFSNKTVAIGDYNARTIYLLDGNGSIGEITTTMPIYQFCISENGIVAVELNDSEITWIYLYDREGKELAYFKTTMGKSGFPIDLTISPNGQIVGISYLYVSGGEMKSTIAFFNFGGVGQNETDNYVGGYDYQGALIPVIQFINSDTAFALSDERIMFYKGNQKPVSLSEQLLTEEIQGVYYNEKYVCLILPSDREEDRFRAQIYNTNGEIVNNLYFSLEYTDIQLKNDYIYIYNENQCQINHVNGKLKYNGSLLHTTGLLVPSDHIQKLTTVGMGSIYNIELK